MEILIIAAGLAADFFSKRWALATLKNGRTVDLIHGFFDFEYVENRGAAFGIFQGRVMPLTVVSLLILALLVFYYFRYGRKNKITSVALALIMGGAAGNITDRIIYGYVVDFIHFHIGDTYHFPTFNVADVMVVSGVILMLIYTLFIEREENGTKTQK